MMTSEIATTAGVDKMANSFRGHLPAQLTWVDHYSRGKPVTYLGQELKDNNGLWLTEFWNRSVHRIASLDNGQAPQPGPGRTGSRRISETPDSGES